MTSRLSEVAALLDVALDGPDDTASVRPVVVPEAEPPPDALPPAVAWALVTPLPVADSGQGDDRSGGHHRLVRTCVSSGLTPGQTFSVVLHYAPSVEKYGERLAEETARSYQKHAADLGGQLLLLPGQSSLDSWTPVDLGPHLRGEIERPEPSVGLRRSDGLQMIYPGREHAVIGEMESGKSWFCAACAAQELLDGHVVVYLHFEEADPSDTVGRLQALGVRNEVIEELFLFVGPDRPGNADDLSRLLDLAPTLVIVDGVNEAMSLHRWGIRDEDGAALLRRHLVKPCTRAGAATLQADHVVKDPERRGRTAIGSVHKVNGLSGSLILLENAEPFGRGQRGRSHVYIQKDRPGHLRRHGQMTKVPGRTFMGEMIVDDTRESVNYLDLRLVAPRDDATTAPEIQSLTDVIHSVISQEPKQAVPSERMLFALLRKAGHGVQDNRVRAAVEDLLVAGRLVEHPGPRNARGYRAVATAAEDQ